MGADQDGDASTDRELIAYAADVVSTHYGITIDEAMHVLYFEAALFGVSLSRVAHLSIVAKSPGVADVADGGDAPTAAVRAARRWGC